MFFLHTDCPSWSVLPVECLLKCMLYWGTTAQSHGCTRYKLYYTLVYMFYEVNCCRIRGKYCYSLPKDLIGNAVALQLQMHGSVLRGDVNTRYHSAKCWHAKCYYSSINNVIHSILLLWGATPHNLCYRYHLHYYYYYYYFFFFYQVLHNRWVLQRTTHFHKIVSYIIAHWSKL